MEAPRGERVHERRNYVRLADEVLEAPRPPLDCQNLIAHVD
jgi:hypothetical protein